ncbi:HAD family hydrolase, partial [Mycobacterium sp.]|uniref:HAD family hydrolase n=1 Tax=Mycobacterium sp. TaxID=1785 RepID=UPI00345C4504
LVAERGGRWLPEAQSRLMGMSTPEWARYLREDLGVDLPPEQIAAAVADRMAARYARQLPLMPDATNTLGRVGQRWRLALASSSPRALIDTVLATAGWTRLFDVTISTEEVGSGKPAPDVYLATVERLKVAARSAVAIEDSTNGLRSAAAAGLRLIAVPRPSYPPAADALNGADLVLTRLSDLSVAAIESLS